MFKAAKTLPHPSSASKSANKSKGSPIDKSTTIQSHSLSLQMVHKPNIPLPSHSKYHQCCNSLTVQPPPFQPAVHSLPFEVYPDSWGSMSRSKKEQWEMLIKDTRIKHMERTERKLREEEQKAMECTFSPKITQFTLPNKSQQNIHAKLYNEAEERRQAQIQAERQELQKKRLQIENLQNKEYDASKWKILNSQKFDLEPLYKRLQKVIEEKRKNKKMIAEKEQNSYPFRPAVSSTSKQMVEKKKLLENVVDRLIDDFTKRENRMTVLRQSMEANLKQQCTFSPIINNYLPAQNPKTHHKQPKQDNQTNLFTPSINPISSLMMQDRSNETTQQKYFRMINTPAIKKADKISQIEAEIYAECCFNPEINQISKHIHTAGHKHHACQLKKVQSPTYRPSINQSSKFMSESKRAKSLEIIKKKTREKEEEYRQSAEYLKMKQCTFRPLIKDNKTARTTANTQMTLHDVAGFQRFYQNRQKFNEKERARKLLQQRLFQLQKSYDLRMGKTKASKKV